MGALVFLNYACVFRTEEAEAIYRSWRTTMSFCEQVIFVVDDDDNDDDEGRIFLRVRINVRT